MPITVDLQEMYSYSFVMLVIAGIVMSGIIIFAFIMLIKRRKKKKNVPKQEIPVPVLVPVAEPVNVKQKYYGQLHSLETDCRNNKISNRMAYQELSRIIRYFVYETTGIKVHNYTLQEIAAANLSPDLYSFIRECYAPEFAVDESGEIYGSIMKARKVIAEWN